MDLVATLRNKIDVLDDGEYIPGLKAVLLHIETAFRHLSRGQEADDDTAFTDAIYRTNQAFEGSIKEAYRVLAGQDPAKKRPFDIEGYLETNKVFRSRVLSQFTTYRTEWRNPSAHDYKLDFDESEAFLALVSVSAFACLLLDQIAERLSYLRAQAEAEAQKQAIAETLAASVNASLLTRTVDVLRKFCSTYTPSVTTALQHTETQFIGALHGFVASAAPELTVLTEARVAKGRAYRADLIVKRGEEELVVELKRRLDRKNFQNVLAQVEHYMLISGIKNGIALFLPESPSQLQAQEIEVTGIGGRLTVLSAEGSNPSLQELLSGKRNLRP
ncbi:hypothetical protein N6G02_18825 [Cupriavidus gilardii]|uniref:Uncharacterized protein n=1 Tax=Cupriavidus gilardii TaxID=82541 RepID=A0ABY4VR72_9BURK|nr:hypothetical protein [Cupriavidus gilardii]MCT9118200.1 hypothetical protein [Cupriavidus gilardii]USE77250.1 hypothetical protein NDR89_08335 [Cupriavidus gilardii]